MHLDNCVGHAAQKPARLLDRGVGLRTAAGNLATAADQIFRAKILQPVKRAAGPVEMKRIACVECRLGLDQVTRVERA
jgi:hypothetical protein